WQDLFVGNDFEFPDRLYRNNRNGTFTEVTSTVLPHTTWFSMGSDCGDINNDGLIDFMCVDMSGTTHYKAKTTMGAMGANTWFMQTADPPQYMRNCLFLNTGTPRFMEVAFQ
ncbi:MAG: VCBS repeat-containing protein, partial [Akkermansiaceae bacterium]|nr:VCBS repeat-containing protein [Akkermansiaceae bacterium]